MKKKFNSKVISALVVSNLMLSQYAAAAAQLQTIGTYTIAEGTFTTYKYWGVDTATALPTLQAQPWWGNGGFNSWTSAQSTLTRNLYNAMASSSTLPANQPVFAYAAGTTGGGPQYFISLNGGTSFGNYSGSQIPTNDGYFISGSYYWILTTLLNSQPSVNLAPNAYALRSVYNIQSAALNAGLSYDCNIFDKQGFCLSTGGRYSTTNSPETVTTSGLLIGSYRYDKNIRLGAWVDQNLSTNNTTGMTLSNSNPLFGVFGAWAERNDGLGYDVKVSAGYGDKDVTVTRTTTNQGTSQIRMRGISTVSSYGFAIDGGLIASPYAGVKYTSINRGSYTEGGSGALTYDNLRQESVTAVAGAKLAGKIDSQTGFVLSAGIEHDLNHNVGQYSAGSSNTTAFNSKVQKTRPVVTAGVYYDIDKTQRIGLNAIHRQEAFQTTTSTTALATYTVGF